MTEQLSVQETFKQKLSDNIKENFMNLLPDEMLSSLIDSAMEDFINGPVEKRFETKSEYSNGRYQNVNVPSKTYNAYNDPNTLKGMIWVEIVKTAKEQLSKLFSSPEWQQRWEYNNGTSEQIVTIVEEIITKNPDVFVNALFRNIISGAMLSTISSIRNNNSNVPFMGI